jgi:predicted nucleic acid-binding protein
MHDAILPVFTEMDSADLQFVISEISVYEAQCRLPVGKHTEALQFMDKVPRFPIDTNTHLIVGVVTSCYRDHEKTKGHAKEISLQDTFNAACAIQNNALLATADYEDYPLPFFDPIYRWNIANDSSYLQKICLLVPDVAQFDNYSERWVKAAGVKRPVRAQP